MIQVKNVSLAFTKEYYALYNISLNVAENEKVALLGDSESGKTTLLRVIASLENFNRGKVFLKGINLNQVDFKDDISLGYMSNNPVVFNNKTVYENLYYVLKIRNIDPSSAKIKINQALKQYEIESLKNIKIKTLSHYQKLIVQFARLSLRKIELYLIDNIFENTTKQEKDNLIDLIKNLQKQNATFLIATNDEQVATQLTNKIIKIKFGTFDKES
jgi:ABC-type sugar transport system ATPase subunit